MLEIGTKAPAFELPDQNGTMHTLEEYRGKKVILDVQSRPAGSGSFILSLQRKARL